MMLMEKLNESQSLKSTAAADEGMKALAPGFEPGRLDVICGRGRTARDHAGNVSFRLAIEQAIDKYSDATTKLEKSIIVSSIVQSIRAASPKGGFVKKENGRWYEVGDHMAREKVGQSLRDLLHTRYSSSTKAKKIRRKEITAKMSDDVDELIMTNVNVASKMQRLALDIRRGASDQYLSDLFNQTNAAILDEIKKDERLIQAACCYSRNVANDDDKSCYSEARSSVTERGGHSASKLPVDFESLHDEPPSKRIRCHAPCCGDEPPDLKRGHSEGCCHGPDSFI